MNSIPLISNVPVVNFSMNRGNTSPEVQMRQEINTSLVALKKEAGTLEGLISEALQILDEVNNRIATLENDTIKKSDIVDVVQSGNMNPVTSNAVSGAISALDVSSVGGSGKYISAISETDGKINATATNLATSVTSGNNAPVTSGAVADKIGLMGKQALIYNGDTYDGTTKNFTSSIKNFRYLYIQLATNINYDYILLPTDNIGAGTSVMRTVMIGYNQGQVTLPFPYQSTAEITILSDTTFKCISYYNNINWILKVSAIWGVQ